ncbi:MAG: 23S rRNA (guanosine(2251)-2'-O)-methyltransferase RlmB [Pelagibacterales bacterium]|nr:23S rRNA (guanosine(2251)-2'-O)-methyltransferase RlmB [Pelagibacterales bacterium]
MQKNQTSHFSKSQNQNSKKFYRAKTGNNIVIYGKHPVFSAIQKKRRKIIQILVTKNTQNELDEFLKKNKIFEYKNLIKIVDPNQLDSLLGKDQLHQGIAIECSKLPIKNQFELLEELHSLEKEKLPNLLLLDQLSDPQNIGAIIRSAVSFGVTKIIFCEHNAPKESATMARSSVGTIEMADIIVVTNFSNLIEKLKKIGYWCIGLDGCSNHSICEIKNYDHVALVVGSEGNGIRDLVKKNCDILTKIAINENVESLNASVATSIALYELSKK